MVHVVGIPFDKKSSFLKGAARAPAAIREVLLDGSSSLLSESGHHMIDDIGMVIQEDLKVDTYQDIFDELQKLDLQQTHIFIGGDHSISYPTVQAVSKTKGAFDILHFDAHTDLYDIYEDDPYSHACPFARIMEEGTVQRLVQVGIRTMNPHQLAQVEKFGVEVINMQQISEAMTLTFKRPLYISIDVDVFDPAHAPGVSHYEPGGMTPRQVISILQQISAPIVGGDIVELNPVRDTNGMTAHLSAKLLKELASAIHRGKGRLYMNI